jgi:AcrR family transcriptional regulator
MKIKKTEQTSLTKAKIRAAALKLFNEQGTTHVHTHDIATEVQISPGNLYYHYRNKEQIIRELFEEIELYDVAAWEQKAINPAPNGFASFMEFFFGSMTRYRFFFREFSVLLQKDADLAARWREKYASLSKVMRQAALRWVSEGIMQPFADEKDLDAFIDNVWIITKFSSVYLEAKQNVAGRKLQNQGVELIMRMLLPYHTKKGQQEIQRYLQGR